MYPSAGAAALCCQSNTQPGYALTAGAGANLATVKRPTGPRTIMARDVPFPMVDAYRPITDAGGQVPGLNVWPRRANRLGRRYYGLETEEVRPQTAKTANTLRRIATNEQPASRQRSAVNGRSFSGFGDPFTNTGGYGNVDWLGNVGLPPVMPGSTPPIGSSGSSGGINWDTFFGGLFKTLPGTISAVTGRGDPLLRSQQGYTPQPSYSQYGVPPEGYYYDSSGRLVKQAVNNVTDFITENPLLVGGAILGAVLLFMRPPGRR